MNKVLMTSLAALLLVAPMTGFAKSYSSGSSSSRSFSSGSSSSSRSFSSGSSKSYSSGSASSSKPSTPSTPSTSAPKTYSSGTSSGPSSTKPSSTTSASDQNVNRSMASSSLKSYQSQFAKPTTTVKSSPPPGITVTHVYHYNDYQAARTRYYSGYTPPRYVYAGPSSYGAWDSLWLYMMLSNMNSTWYYNHQNDAGVQAWKQQAQQQAQTNAELQAQLTQLNGQVAAMQGQPVDPNYMPPGTDPAMALAADQVVADEPEPTHHVVWPWILLVVVIGGAGSWYVLRR